jgi:hypothetical protein
MEEPTTNLTPEEIDAIKNLTSTLFENDGEMDGQKFIDPLEVSKNQYNEIFNDRAMLDCPTELVFVVACNVMNKNNLGEIVSTEQVVMRNYHIPLNNKTQALSCVDRFFDKFHEKIQEAATETIKQNKEES